MRTFYTTFGLRCVRANEFNAELPKCSVELPNTFAGQAFCSIDVKDGVPVTIKSQRLAVTLDVSARVVSM